MVTDPPRGQTRSTSISEPRQQVSRALPSSDWAPLGQTLAVLVTAGTIVVGQLYVVLPLFGAIGETLDSSTGATTWMATAFGIAYALGFLLAGPASDRFGPRRVILVGLFATAVTTAAVAVATSLALGIVLRVVQGLAAAALAPAAYSYIAEHVDPDRRAFAVNCISSAFFAAAVVMQVAAQLLGSWSWQVAFVAPALVLLLIAGPAYRVLRPDSPPSASAGESFAAMPRLLARPSLLALYVASTTLLGGFVTIYAALELAGPEGLAGNDQAILALRASALPAMIAAPLLTRVLVRVPARSRLIVAMMVAVAGALGAALVSNSTIALGAALLVLVAAVAVAAPAIVELISAQAGPALGSATALYAFALFVGASVGPPIASAFAAAGFAPIALGAAATLGVGAVLAWLGRLQRAG